MAQLCLFKKQGIICHVHANIWYWPVCIFVQESKRSSQDLCGRSDGNVKVIFPREGTDSALDTSVAEVKAGDYVLVKVCFALG